MSELLKFKLKSSPISVEEQGANNKTEVYLMSFADRHHHQFKSPNVDKVIWTCIKLNLRKYKRYRNRVI